MYAEAFHQKRVVGALRKKKDGVANHQRRVVRTMVPNLRNLYMKKKPRTFQRLFFFNGGCCVLEFWTRREVCLCFVYLGNLSLFLLKEKQQQQQQYDERRSRRRNHGLQ